MEEQPGGWSGWDELPPMEPAQEAPEQAPLEMEEGELDDDAEADFAPEGGCVEILVVL